jgi:hypothetical protein
MTNVRSKQAGKQGREDEGLRQQRSCPEIAAFFPIHHFTSSINNNVQTILAFFCSVSSLDSISRSLITYCHLLAHAFQQTKGEIGSAVISR